MLQKYQKFLLLTLAAGSLATGGLSAADLRIGVVNFAHCVAESKVGKAEQAHFEEIKKQLGSHLEKTEKELNDLAAKLNDPDYMDGLSPEAENTLKEKIQALNEELARYQNQYYQVLNQANMKIVQNLTHKVGVASEQVAKEKKLDLVLHKDGTFFYSTDLDVTQAVIAKLDKTFEHEEQEKEKQTAATPSK